MTIADLAGTANTVPAVGSIGIIIPTFNAEPHWPELSAALAVQGVEPDQILIVDSSSNDRTTLLARQSGYRVICIEQKDFRHGATRQMACEQFPDAELLVFMTQDAIPLGAGAVERLCQALGDPCVGAAYGRQAPREQANPIERHARLFNYPAKSLVKSCESRHTLGIKTAFCSNSFAVYRCSALRSVGGFPKDLLLAEDSVVAARLLMSGWKVTYQADAVAVHSHPIRFGQEFSRYFDTGAHHSREAWLQETFGGAGSEGALFIRSELRYLWEHAPFLIPEAMFRTMNKLIGYRLGKLHRYLPTAVSRKLSGHPHFWDAPAARGNRSTGKPEEYPNAKTLPPRLG